MARSKPCCCAFGERQKLGDAIKAERERLFLVADGFDEAALAEEAEYFDADAARGKLEEIDRELKAEEDRAREIFASLRAAETEMDAACRRDWAPRRPSRPRPTPTRKSCRSPVAGRC